MPVEFINNAAIDRTARKRIRSHVAMGKNAGKKLARPSRKRTTGMRFEIATPIIDLPKFQDDPESSGFKGLEEETIYEIKRQVGDSLSVLSFPEQHSVGDKRLVQRGMIQ